MPRGLTERGRRKLRGKRRVVRNRRDPRPVRARRPAPMGGMSDIETVIYLAASKLGLNFQFGVDRGPRKALGGASADFVFFDYHVILEVNGPLHETDLGQAKDFWRRVNRTRLWPGYRQVDIREPEVWKIWDDYGLLLRKLGQPG